MEVLEKYRSGKSVKEIALELGCTHHNISWILRTKFGYNRKNKTQCNWCPSKDEYSITGVYCIFSLDTRKFYVGSSQNVYKRVVRGHYGHLKRGIAKNKELQKDFNTYGEEGFVCDIWHKCNSIEDALDVEYNLLKVLDKNLLYNKTLNIYNINILLSEKNISKFNSKISKTNYCWNFTDINDDGYGQLYIGNKRILAHRFSYELHKGSCGKNMIGHKCNNKKCCNPEHLYITNHVENTQYAMDCKKECLTKASPLIFNESAELGR